MMCSNLMCKECGYVPVIYYGHKEVYNDLFKSINDTTHDCKGHNLVEIDEEIILAMSIIVNKGYKTNFSCAGHLKESLNGGYVYFMEPLADEILPTSEWITVDESKDTIRGLNRLDDKYEKGLTMDDMVILQEDINMFRVELLKWALSLPIKK